MKKLLPLLIMLISASCFSQNYKNETTDKPQKVKVFPNPAANVINILGLLNSNRADISITNMYGTEVLRHQWEIRKNVLNIPVADLEKGIYSITICSKEQNVETKFYKN